jgi:carbonic anhydrase
MSTIDYIYRFDPENPSAKPRPRDADAARRVLEDGNRMFSKWMESCRTSTPTDGEPCYLVMCNGLEVGMVRTAGEMPKQSPFAVVVGCSDARVPTEMIFGQGFNDLFVIRVAGNVLGDVCLGSIDFALRALSESVRVIVMLGHSGCGAVTAAVDAYLRPLKFWSKSNSPNLRSLTQRIFVSVREAANGFKEAWGPDAASMPGYREALIEAAVCINAAQSAFDLRQDVERSGKWEIEVLYGVHNIRNHQVCMPVDPSAPRADANVRLAQAATNPKEFHALAVQMAELLAKRPALPAAMDEANRLADVLDSGVEGGGVARRGAGNSSRRRGHA